MTAEQLNIKINLDISDLLTDAKKVKTQLKRMADSVKGSIPKIGSESKNAKSALSGVAKAGKEVQKSLDGIGDEARDSLGNVVTQSQKAAKAIRNIKTDNKFSFGFDVDELSGGADEASGAIDRLQTSMAVLTGSNVFDIISRHFGSIKKAVKSFAAEVDSAFTWDMSGNFDRLKGSLKKLGSAFKNFTSKNLGDVKKSLKNSGKSFKDIFSGIGMFIKDISKETISLATDIVGKITAIVGAVALLSTAKIGANIANDTKQYREEQSKLVSAFQASGASAKQATQVYNNLFRFLGQSDRAVEAANHIAKLTNNTQHLAEWTTICQGVYATFGNSLNIEGLTEAANETARVGKVTGVLADALNWAGVSEDAFNAALEKTTNLEQREALIRQTLNGIYQNAAKLYEENNKEIIKQNEAQARLDATMARIGQQTQVLVTSWTNFKNTLMTAVGPAIVYVSAAISVLLDKLSSLIQWIGSLFGISFSAGNIGGIVDGVSTSLDSAAGSANGLKDSLNAATGAAEKLKRTTMGFDELNIVTNPSSGGGGSVDTTGITGLTGNGVVGQIGEQIELVKGKVEEFFDKWKTQIAIISGALGALGITSLLEHLGKAIGLGDKFLGTMKTIKKLAATAITIVLQYTLMSEFLDNYINGEGFKEYLKALLIGGIGTGVLYAMWGPTGLVIGLGVTAVASIKSVIDNGGITNAESAVVALTGIASAIGAISIALKKLGFGKVLADFGAFFALLKEGNGVLAAFSAAFPKISTALAGIGPAITSATSAVGGFLTSIGSIFGLTGGAAIAAGAAVVVAAIGTIVGAIAFLKENWDKLGIAIKNFFNNNVMPKFKEMQKALKEAKDAIASIIPDGLKKLLSDIWDGIKNIVSAIGDWFAKIKWLDAIGKAFKTLGGIVVSAVSGVIAGAINGLVSLIQGAVNFISGVVQIVSGIVKAIVALFTGDLKKAGEAVQNIADGIVRCFKGLYDATIGIVVEFVKGIINWFTELWDVLVGHSIVPDMVDAIIKWFFKLPTEIFKMMADFVKTVIAKFTELAKAATIKFKEIVDKIKSAWTNVKNTWDAAGGYFGNIWAKIQNIFINTPTWFKGIFQNAWNNITGIFKNVRSYFTGVWNTIKNIFSNVGTAIANGISGAVKGAINSVLRTATKKINSFINMINNAIGVINKIPGVNIRRISQLSIPQLATGGIVTSETLARIGERGKKEAVLPLEQNTSWMDILADKIAARGGNGKAVPANIILQVDGRQLGWATIDNINAITKQTGGLKLHIV